MAQIPSASELAAVYGRKAKRGVKLTEEAARLRSRGQLTMGSCDAIFESSLLALVTSFESFVEDLFYSALLGHAGLDDAEPRVHIPDRSTAEGLALRGQHFLDWLPLDSKAKQNAEPFFVISPFARLAGHEQENRVLKELQIVRNRIAHDSSKSRSEFGPLAATLPQRRRTPAGLLQQLQQGRSRFESYAEETGKITLALASQTLVDAKSLLTPEFPHQQGAKPGPGRYACTTCRTRVRLGPRKRELPRCDRCQRDGTLRKTTWERQYSA